MTVHIYTHTLHYTTNLIKVLCLSEQLLKEVTIHSISWSNPHNIPNQFQDHAPLETLAQLRSSFPPGLRPPNHHFRGY